MIFLRIFWDEWRGANVLMCVARWCFGSARIWRMSTRTTWRYEKLEFSDGSIWRDITRYERMGRARWRNGTKHWEAAKALKYGKRLFGVFVV